MVHEKNWRVSLCVQELCHPRDFLWILAAIPVCQNTTDLPVPSWFHLYLVLDFWLARATTGFPVLFVQHVNLTQALDGNLSHSDLPFLESHCRLTQLWLVDVDELEEDVGWRMWTGGRTRWQAWNHDQNEVLRVALYSNTVLKKMWFLTVDRLVRISVFIAKLSER